MNTIYNSASYCVVEFRDPAGEIGGYEIMDKLGRREIYLGGDLAIRFREGVQRLIEAEPSTEDVDEFLSGFQGLMQTPVALH
ncbi:DUF3567 domain-containing protein [Burkholderiaceae bacterium FT117]|uniref:BTH_I0359 family protein n=1 Tax=Zeimonas sediminis TaxID=2944268 RepID=UPI0023432122|nr:DUF3567 domain-containing protein [Zeimonas sediminis]MCM5571331.1 DUF3567 domain-containing protein [Zeimonas sediminis]